MSESTREVYILGGTGNVGSELTRQVLERSRDSGGNRLALAGIANSDGLHVLRRGGGVEDILRVTSVMGRERFKRSVRDNRRSHVGPDETIEGLFKRLESGAIVVDCTSLAEEVLGLYADLANGRGEIQDGCLITVNKSPLVVCGPEVFNTLAGMRKRFGFAGTIMAGGSAVIDQVLEIDGVSGVEGCLSGTLGYLCNAMEAEGTSDFMFMLARAKSEGFTQPDPRVDLKGKDVAEKLVILARAAGYSVQLSDVKIEPFIPEEFLKDGCNVEEFMARNIEDGRLNVEMKRRFDDATERGEKLRYVAEMKVNGEGEKPTLRVGLKPVKVDHLLANIDGTGNRVLIYTRDSKQDDVVLRASIGGPGAGPKVTAQAVMRDIQRMLGV